MADIPILGRGNPKASSTAMSAAFLAGRAEFTRKLVELAPGIVMPPVVATSDQVIAVLGRMTSELLDTVPGHRREAILYSIAMTAADCRLLSELELRAAQAPEPEPEEGADASKSTDG